MRQLSERRGRTLFYDAFKRCIIGVECQNFAVGRDESCAEAFVEAVVAGNHSGSVARGVVPVVGLKAVAADYFAEECFRVVEVYADYFDWCRRVCAVPRRVQICGLRDGASVLDQSRAA